MLPVSKNRIRTDRTDKLRSRRAFGRRNVTTMSRWHRSPLRITVLPPSPMPVAVKKKVNEPGRPAGRCGIPLTLIRDPYSDHDLGRAVIAIN